MYVLCNKVSSLLRPHSVHFGINLPSKTTPLSFLPIPPSNLQTAQASLYNGFSLTPYLKFVFFGEGFDP